MTIDFSGLYMSQSLNSLKGAYIRSYIGTSVGVTKGDTRSLDHVSYIGVAERRIETTS